MQATIVNQAGVVSKIRIPLQVTQPRKVAEAGEGYRADELLPLIFDRNILIAPDCEGFHPAPTGDMVVRRFFLTLPLSTAADEIARQTKRAAELLDYLFYNRATPPV